MAWCSQHRKIREAWRDSAEQEIFAAPVDKDYGECVKWANDLITRAEPKVIIAKLLAVLSTRNKGYSLDRELIREQEKLKRPNKNSSFKSKSRGQTKPKGYFRRFRSIKGSQNTGQILNAMCTALKVERDEIGAIRVNDKYILVELMPLALSKLEQSHAKAGLSKFGLLPDEEKERRSKKYWHNKNKTSWPKIIMLIFEKSWSFIILT